MNKTMMMMNNSIEIKRLGNEDIVLFKDLILLFKDVFEMDEAIAFDDAHLSELLAKESFIALAALSNNNVVGGLTAYIMPMYYTLSAEAYIYDVAVGKGHQRKGIGKLLIQYLKDHCAANGIRTMFVEAHDTDIDAVDFYNATGGHAEKVVHFNYNIL